MEIYKLQKYDPSLFDENGIYSLNDWTSVSQIGEIFCGSELTIEKYTEMENRYIDCVEYLFTIFGREDLVVYSDGYRVDDNPNFDRSIFGIEDSYKIEYGNRSRLSGDKLITFCRLCLRDLQGYAVSNEKDFLVSFTGDYYVHVGCSAVPPDLKKKLELRGLYFVHQDRLGSGSIDNEYYMRLLPKAKLNVVR